MADISNNDTEGSPDGLKEFKGSHIEALRSDESHFHVDPDIERQITRKFDLHIIPWLFGIWLAFEIQRRLLCD